MPAKRSKPVQTANPQKLTLEQAIGLAKQHHMAGRLPQARALYQQILQADSRQPVALHLLGVVAHQMGKHQIAVERITEALAMMPDYVEAHINLGNALLALGRLDEAVASYGRALVIKPEQAETHNNLGNALQDLGRLDEALASYDKALALRNDYAEAHNNRGTALQELGRGGEALASYHAALAIAPDYAEAHRHLTVVRKFTDHDDDIAAMEAAYAAPDLADEPRMHLAFALGKAFEDLGRYPEAFGFYRTGNALKRATLDFSIVAVKKTFDGLKALFNEDLFLKQATGGAPDKTPIFVLGMPRSGTSLVEQILASHPQVHGAGELSLLGHIVATQFSGSNDPLHPDRLDQAPLEDFSRAGDEYLHQLREGGGAAPFITDKMPENFALIGMIKLMLPGATIIHCRRSPLDTCLSIFKNLFTANGYDYAYDLNDLGAYYNLYRDLMDHWRRVLPGFIYDVDYEDLVADQEAQSRALLSHCGLAWDDACLDFHKTARPVRTLSAAQVRRPIFKDSIQSWKRYEDQLAPLMALLT